MGQLIELVQSSNDGKLKEVFNIMLNYKNKNFDFFFKDYELLIDQLIGIEEYLTNQKVLIPNYAKMMTLILAQFNLNNFALKDLFKGTDLKYKNNSIKQFNISPSIILSRSQIECYFVFFYLFVQPETEEEKIFRNLLFRAAGLNRRQDYEASTEEFIKQKEEEGIQIEAFKEQIKNNSHYQTFTEKQKKYIIKKLPERVINGDTISLEKLIGNENFNKMFVNQWKLFSNYVHSESIALLQIKEYYEKPRNIEDLKLQLCHNSCHLISLFIVDMMNIFNINKSLIESNLYERIKIYDYIARKSEESI